MVRKYIKKGTRKPYTTESMKLAIEAVVKRGVSIRQASLDNGIPHATLSRKIHLLRLAPEKGIDKIASPEGNLKKTLFSKDQELTLCKYIRTLENELDGFSGLDIRVLAYELAEKYKLPHRFKKENEMAGEDWLRGFLNRHPDIVVRKRKSIVSRTPILIKEKIDKLISTLEFLVDSYKLQAKDVYTLDETTITCAAKSDSKTNNLEKDLLNCQKLVTAEICFSASGNYLPLMLIFPSNDKSLSNGAPPGSKIEFDPSGQMQITIFLKWLKMFIKSSKSSKNTPVILIVNKYQRFLKNLEVLELIDKHGVHILTFPSDAAGKLFPMNYCLIKALSQNYAEQVMNWSEIHPDQSFTMSEVYELFGNAFMNVATIAAPVESFQNTGIWPIDRVKIEENLDLSLAECNSLSTSRILKNIHGTCSPESLSHGEISDEESSSIAENELPLDTHTNVPVHEPQIVIVHVPAQYNTQQNDNQSVNGVPNKLENFQEENHLHETYPAQGIIQQQQYQYRQENQEQVLRKTELSSVYIPPEAQLSEIDATDLARLMQRNNTNC